MTDGDNREVTQPQTLGDLLRYVMDSRGYKSLSELGRHTTILYQTLWAWYDGTRNLKRPPTPAKLHQLATDLGLPREVVFRAAMPAAMAAEALAEPDMSAGELEVIHTWRQLSPQQRRATERLMRDLLDRDGRNDQATCG